MHRVPESSWRWCVLAAAVILVVPTLGYAFGRDQCLYHYVGREWLHGLIPYQDTFDQKPPLIFAVHAFGIAVFGTGEWVIRLLDACALLGIGWAAAQIVRPNGTGARFAHGFLVAAVLYYFYFDYWDTAQVEIWEGLFILLALVAVRDLPSFRLACIGGGAALGVAFLFKFPALLFTPLFALVLLTRAIRREGKAHGARDAIVASVLALLGALIPLIVVVAAFGLAGGLTEAYDVLIGYNAFYASNKRSEGYAEITTFLVGRNAAPTIMCVGALIFASSKSAKPESSPTSQSYWIGTVGFAIATLSVAAQGKFYGYHWGILVPFEVILLLLGINALADASEARLALGAACPLAIALATGPAWLSNAQVTYPSYVSSWLLRIHDPETRPEFLAQFVGGYSYSYASLEMLGRLIARKKRDGDLLHVHGFEPVPYVVSGLRSPSRFFAEFPVTDPLLAYRRAEWAAVHEHALQTHPPRFVVDFVYEQARIVQRLRAGYRPLGRAAQFVLLVRDPANLNGVAAPRGSGAGWSK